MRRKTLLAIAAPIGALALVGAGFAGGMLLHRQSATAVKSTRSATAVKAPRGATKVKSSRKSDQPGCVLHNDCEENDPGPSASVLKRIAQAERDDQQSSTSPAYAPPATTTTQPPTTSSHGFDPVAYQAAINDCLDTYGSNGAISEHDLMLYCRDYASSVTGG